MRAAAYIVQLALLTGLLLCPVGSGAVEHAAAVRLENRYSVSAGERWSLRGSLQARFRDSFHDHYYRKLDAGARYDAAPWLSLPVSFRLEDKSREGGWLRAKYILLDPTVELLELGRWLFDVRTRFQMLLNDTSFQYLRVQPRIQYHFCCWEREMSWWVYNDFYIPVERHPLLTNHESNNFSTGLNYPIGRRFDLNVYYMVFSMKALPESHRKHIHQSCFSLGFSI